MDLFSKLPPAAPPAAPKPLTVWQLNNQARLLVERNFARVSVVGEISGLKIVQGHHYFALKDERSQVSAVLFQREARALEVKLRDGMEVVATGKVTIYSQYGRYQLVLDRLALRGQGELAAAFEQLKARLAGEGLFDSKHKRRLPRLPRRVAVVTSPTGAVIKDIVEVATRRFPRRDLLIVPTRVQGGEAAPQIVRALKRLYAMAPGLGIDVIIVARGGGSLEDLWCFNDEAVARTIAASPVPIVSAVGHETDFTIADFVADVRAPTPSVAAELVFPVHSELAAALSDRLERARRAMRRHLEHRRLQLRALRGELRDAKGLLRSEAQRLGHLTTRQAEAVRRMVVRRRATLSQLERRLLALHPKVHLRDVRARLGAAEGRVAVAARQRLGRERAQLDTVEHRLRALSPLGVLERGYAIVLSSEGHVVRDAAEVDVGERLEVRLHQGRLGTRVETKGGDT